MSLQAILDELKKFNVLESIDRSLMENEAQIVDLNIQQHVELGVDNTGLKFSSFEPYSNQTIEFKAFTGTLTNGNPIIVNLDQDGDFHDGFYIDRERLGKYNIDSKDSKRDKLVNKYDPELFGLTDKNQRFVNNEIILPDINNDIRKALSKGLNK